MSWGDYRAGSRGSDSSDGRLHPDHPEGCFAVSVTGERTTVDDLEVELIQQDQTTVITFSGFNPSERIRMESGLYHGVDLTIDYPTADDTDGDHNE